MTCQIMDNVSYENYQRKTREDKCAIRYEQNVHIQTPKCLKEVHGEKAE